MWRVAGAISLQWAYCRQPLPNRVTSELPVTRPQSRASKHGHSFQFRQADIAALIGRKPRISLFLLVIAVVAAFAHSIAGWGNHMLTSGLNDFVRAVFVLTLFPRDTYY